MPHTPKITLTGSRVKTENKETPRLIPKKTVAPQEKEERVVVKNEENTPFTAEQVVEMWEAFKKERSGIVSDTEELVLNRRLEKSEKNNVKIFLESQLEISILGKFESDLIQYLRKNLKNTFIQIEKEVSKQEENKNLYTSKEKFEYMAEQNPELRKLKDRLGLDFEY